VLSGIPADKLTSLLPVELAARLIARAGRGWGLKPYDAMFVAHDLAVSLLPWPRDTGAIYAYEDGALRTFERAMRMGLRRIWDLPAAHYLTVERIVAEECRRWPGAMVGPPASEPAWKRRRKDRELALASTVSVASTFTKRSLEDRDVRAQIVVTPYGFPTDAFVARSQPPSGPFTVLSVGMHDLRKGTPYLLEAWKRATIPDAELHLVGPLRLAKSFLDDYAGVFRHWPHVPKAELAPRYAAADLLAFPTLVDGFGLVIQEAMSCGTPVVTTPCGGGPECITDGVDGFLVPPRDIEALVERFRFAAQNRDHFFQMGRRARTRAEAWTWDQAGRALIEGLQL
jgi:alpha-maltose-1-phosphate synthase